MFRVIEKAIIDSDLGIMPENNGEIIRIGIPPLTEERRKQLSKQCKAEGETAKVSVRNARRDGIDMSYINFNLTSKYSALCSTIIPSVMPKSS